MILLPLSILQKYLTPLYVPTSKSSKHILGTKVSFAHILDHFYIYHKLQKETKCVHSINFGKFQQRNQYIFFHKAFKGGFIHEDFTEKISSI